MKLKVNTIDFEALIKDLPIVNPFMFVTETSNVFEYHQKMIQNENQKHVSEVK